MKTKPINVFLSGRLGNGELDDDRHDAREVIGRVGAPFSVFAYEGVPQQRDVWQSDAELRISQSQMFILLLGLSLSPRVADELKFAKRLGLPCYVLARNGPRSKNVALFLSDCGCPVYGYGGSAAPLADVLEAILRHRIEWSDAAEIAVTFGNDAWGVIIEKLRSSPDDVYQFSPRKFEELVAELLAGFGYSVDLTPSSNDGGRDIIAKRSADIAFPSLYYIEAKLWTPGLKVGRPIIQKLLGTGMADRVNGVMLVTPSLFARTVRPYLVERNLLEFVRLVDGQALPAWYTEYVSRATRP